MAEPFLAEIRLFSFNYAPRGWAFCNGQFLPINQNQALFALLGTTYGGNGQTTFALPDLRARVPIHFGSGHTLGERAGEQAHTLTAQEMPSHTHFLTGTSATGASNVNAGNVHGVSQTPVYAPPASLVAINPSTVTSVGGSQPHTNMQPFLTITFCIALEGIFPSHN